jgi:hypothetical protein
MSEHEAIERETVRLLVEALKLGLGLGLEYISDS